MLISTSIYSYEKKWKKLHKNETHANRKNKKKRKSRKGGGCADVTNF